MYNREPNTGCFRAFSALSIIGFLIVFISSSIHGYIPSLFIYVIIGLIVIFIIFKTSSSKGINLEKSQIPEKRKETTEDIIKRQRADRIERIFFRCFIAFIVILYFLSKWRVIPDLGL